MRELNITTREEGQRLDKILSKYLNKAPKSFVYKMLRKKNIKLNGKKATGNEKLSQGDQVCIYLAEDTINKFREEVKAGKQKIKLDVLYEDENVIMVNKPWGILSQKSKPEDISINDQIIPYAVNQGLISEKELQVVKPSICNRLDRNTTGIIICGISIEGLQTMAEMLKHRDMEKYYLCIVKGKLERTQKVSAYLKKDEKTNNVNGILISSFEIEKMIKEINALLKNKCRLQSMSKNTRDNFERFEIENIIKKWKNIFERLEK